MGKYDKLADGVTQLGEVMTDLAKRLDGIETRRADALNKDDLKRVEKLKKNIEQYKSWMTADYKAAAKKMKEIAREQDELMRNDPKGRGGSGDRASRALSQKYGKSQLDEWAKKSSYFMQAEMELPAVERILKEYEARR